MCLVSETAQVELKVDECKPLPSLSADAPTPASSRVMVTPKRGTDTDADTEAVTRFPHSRARQIYRSPRHRTIVKSRNEGTTVCS